MITTASHTSWYNDVEITDIKAAGLPVPSVIRFKLFSLDNRVIIKTIGSLNNNDVNIFNQTFEQVIC